MPIRIAIEPAARLDIGDQVGYLTEHNPEAALRFYDATHETFNKLAEMPGIGTLVETSDRSLSGLRRFPVPGFPKYLIFYRAMEAELRIVRVLHGARDTRSILESN